MDSESGPKKPALPPRRRLIRRPGGAAPAPVAPPKPRGEYLYMQVHFQPVPGARKPHFLAILPQIIERQQEMIRAGALLFSGGYPSSIGGMWLLKVKNRVDAERLVQEHPAVGCSLLTFRLIELEDPMGVVVREDRAPSLETISS